MYVCPVIKTKQKSHRKESCYDSGKHHRDYFCYCHYIGNYQLLCHSRQVGYQADNRFGAGIHCARHFG